MRSTDEYTARLDEARVPYVALDDQLAQGLWRHRSVLRRLADQKGIDLVHAHGYDADYLAAAVRLLFRSRWERIPFVLTAHGYIETTPWNRAKTWLNLAISDRADAVIACSSLTARRLAHRRMRGSVFLVHNGVQIEESTHSEGQAAGIPKPMSRLLDAGPVVGTIGRLSREKRIDVFLSAACLVLEEKPSARFVVVGGGDQRSALERHAAAIGLAGRVVFLGLVRHVDPVLRSLAVLVQPSDAEGTPRSVIEAMARRVPVVTTRAGDMPFMVAEGAAGLLVERGDVRGLARSMLRLLTDPALAARLAEAGQHRAQALFTLDRMAAEVDRVYSRVTRLGPVRERPRGGSLE
jgi:glycosyltransferase involved in cell wall biosynthesis